MDDYDMRHTYRYAYVYNSHESLDDFISGLKTDYPTLFAESLKQDIERATRNVSNGMSVLESRYITCVSARVKARTDASSFWILVNVWRAC